VAGGEGEGGWLGMKEREGGGGRMKGEVAGGEGKERWREEKEREGGWG